MLNGIAVFVMLLMLYAWLGKTWRQRLAGLGFFTDVSVHILCQLMLGGAHDGRLAVLFGCIMFNLFLMTYRRFWGYQFPSENGWVFHRGWFNWRHREQE